MNRRTFFAAIGAAVAGAKAKVWKPTQPTSSLGLDAQRLAACTPFRVKFPPKIKIGDTIVIRKPARFVIRDGAEGLDMDAFTDMYMKPAVESFVNQMETDLMASTYGWQSPANPTRESLASLSRSLVMGRHPLEPLEPEELFEPTADIPLASSCECEEYDD